MCVPFNKVPFLPPQALGRDFELIDVPLSLVPFRGPAGVRDFDLIDVPLSLVPFIGPAEAPPTKVPSEATTARAAKDSLRFFICFPPLVLCVLTVYGGAFERVKGLY